MSDNFDSIFEFRCIRADEEEQAARMEQVCFPPNEACTPEMMSIRVRNAPDLFLTAVDKKTGLLAGLIDGLATNETTFKDEYFTREDIDDPDGKNIMIMGVEVLPEYQGRGLARELMNRYAEREKMKGREQLILTCLESKVPMYEKFGFQDKGWADSDWGGERWHEMVRRL